MIPFFPPSFQVALLFSLWVETVRPYLEIVDEWIVHGHLFDPAKEFIIQRYQKTYM